MRLTSYQMERPSTVCYRNATYDVNVLTGSQKWRVTRSIGEWRDTSSLSVKSVCSTFVQFHSQKPPKISLFWILQVLMQGERETFTLSEKIKMWAQNRWNIWDFIGVSLYFIGFMLRWPYGPYPCFLVVARLFLVIDIMVWYVRVLDIFSVNKIMGPYVNMIYRMVSIFGGFYVRGFRNLDNILQYKMSRHFLKIWNIILVYSMVQITLFKTLISVIIAKSLDKKCKYLCKLPSVDYLSSSGIRCTSPWYCPCSC